MDEYESRMMLRSPEPEQKLGFDDRLRDLYEYMHSIKKESEDGELEEDNQQPDPQQVAAMQAQQQQMMQQQQAMQLMGGLQNAFKAVEQMDPIQRWQVGKELRAYQNALGGVHSGPDFRLNDSALASKNYPDTFGQTGVRAQQILLASGVLGDKSHPYDMIDQYKSRNGQT